MDPVQKAVLHHTFGVPPSPKRKYISCSVCQLRFNSQVSRRRDDRNDPASTKGALMSEGGGSRASCPASKGRAICEAHSQGGRQDIRPLSRWDWGSFMKEKFSRWKKRHHWFQHKELPDAIWSDNSRYHLGIINNSEYEATVKIVPPVRDTHSSFSILNSFFCIWLFFFPLTLPFFPLVYDPHWVVQCCFPYPLH